MVPVEWFSRFVKSWSSIFWRRANINKIESGLMWLKKNSSTDFVLKSEFNTWNLFEHPSTLNKIWSIRKN